MIERLVGWCALLTVLPGTPLASQPSSQTPPLAHWHHTAWTGDTRPPRPGTHTLLQSPDGYLWLAAVRSVLRFDGVRFTVFDSTTVPAFRGLRARNFNNYTTEQFFPTFVDGAGTMWIRGPGGAYVKYRDGSFQLERGSAPSGPGGAIEEIGGTLVLQDSGKLWRYDRRGPRRRYQLPSAVPDTGIWEIAPDSADGMWIGTSGRGVWHVSGGVVRQIGTGTMRVLLHDRSGAVWTIGYGRFEGVWRYANGSWTPLRLPDHPEAPVSARAAEQGPDGSIWFPTIAQGLVRWRNGTVEHFGKREGLSNDRTHGALVDREGSVWVSTDVGLDRLRPGTFATVEPRHGLPFDAGDDVVEDASGALWAAGPSSPFVYRLDSGIVRDRPGALVATRFEAAGGTVALLLGPARGGGVWLAPADGGLVQLSAKGRQRFGAESGLPSRPVGAALIARSGTVWLRHFAANLGRFSNGRYTSVPIGDAPARPGAFVEDDVGRIWISLSGQRTLVAIDTGRSTIVASVPFPPGVSGLSALTLEGGDTLWMTTFRSLVRATRGHAVEVNVPGLADLLSVGTDMAVSGGWLWAASSNAIARVPLAALHRAADGDTTTVVATVFDGLDGLSVPQASSGQPIDRVHRTRDGRIWIATPNGLAVADPAARFVNRVPPRVHIEEVFVDGLPLRLADGGAIRPNPARLEIHFTAASLHLPERVRLQYRLDGAEQRWIDAARPRVASYGRLGPGTYRFRVRAWNEDGVPSTGEATLRFRVQPAWYQSWWFAALSFAAVAGAGAGAALTVHRRRGRRDAERMQARFDAVLAERERIARELHDTLLQGFTGITLKLDGVRGTLDARDAPSSRELTDILLHADTTLREAREMVWDMRSPELVAGDLGAALAATSAHVVSGDGIAVHHRHGRRSPTDALGRDDRAPHRTRGDDQRGEARRADGDRGPPRIRGAGHHA